MAAAGVTTSSKFGLLAVVLGFMAFAGVVGHFFVGPFYDAPPIEVSIAEAAAEIRDATMARLRGEEYEAQSSVQNTTIDDYLTYSFVATALLSILFSIIGFIRHEPMRISIAGGALGALAIAFQVATVLFMALLFALLLAAVIDKLDFSF